MFFLYHITVKKSFLAENLFKASNNEVNQIIDQAIF